jgi:hypothetical protein
MSAPDRTMAHSPPAEGQMRITRLQLRSFMAFEELDMTFEAATLLVGAKRPTRSSTSRRARSEATAASRPALRPSPQTAQEARAGSNMGSVSVLRASGRPGASEAARGDCSPLPSGGDGARRPAARPRLGRRRWREHVPLTTLFWSFWKKRLRPTPSSSTSPSSPGSRTSPRSSEVTRWFPPDPPPADWEGGRTSSAPPHRGVGVRRVRLPLTLVGTEVR